MTDPLMGLLDSQDEPVVDPARQARLARLAEGAQRARLKAAAAGKGELRAKDFMVPVTQNAIADVFGMMPETIKRRLLRCPTVGSEGGRDLYNFKTACEYVLKPRMDIETYLKTLNPADMPIGINKSFWEAQMTKLRYQIAAAEAWATEDVLEVFGTVFMTIKERTKLWSETLRESGMLTDDQLVKLNQLIDDYLSNLHADLIDIPKKRQTRSKISESELEIDRFDGDN